MVYVSRKTRDWLGRALVWVIVGAATFASFALVQDCVCAPPAEACDETCQVTAAIQRLQPAASERRAGRLAEIIVSAAEESDIDPLLLVALAMRESSFSPAVEALTIRGSAGELGLLQVHPRNGRALAMRPEDCERDLPTARCQVVTGARWLAYCFETCPGSVWRGVVHYGTGQCRSETAARADRAAAVAASYYAQAGGTRW